MKIEFKELRLRTKKRIQVIDITSEVLKFLKESSIKNGILIAFAPHATAAITLNENESGLISDIESKIREIFGNGNYKHDEIDDNADSHLASSFIKQFVMLPIKNGEIIRGTWQNILLIELDGPRNLRKVVLEIMGE